jgi:hypothetical protein
MKKIILLAVILVFSVGIAVLSFAGINNDAAEVENPILEPVSEISASGKPKKTLQPFGSQKELDNYFRRLAEQQKRVRKENSNTLASPTNGADSSVAKSKAVTDEEDSITNVQQAGVDEGGIVKMHGEHLIILRRGRLFTVAIGDNSLRPISTVDAFAPDINPGGTWYDEMLVSGNTIAVIGYSYERGGTEIGLFNIDSQGELRYRSTYHLRSNDYYSSRNYASRLIGNKLVFYTPQYLGFNSENPMDDFPALRKWRKGATEKDYQSIVAPTRIYRPARDVNDGYGLALHTVTVCNLDSSEFSCEATGVIGPAGRVFYVSQKSVYVWVTDWSRGTEQNQNRSMLYQMPLDGSAPTALGVSGSPVDQFSFLESEDGYLNVLVRSDAAGDGMWKAEVTAGEVALLRVSRAGFSDGSENVSASRYRELPKPEGYTFQNRFVGEYLLYGTGNSWGYAEEKEQSSLFAVRWTTGEIDKLPLKHSVDRIEAMGKDAVIVGTDGKNLYFSPVRLGVEPRIKSSYVRKNAAQGELRSHGFFYKSEDSNSGLLGLPIREEGSAGYENLYKDSASILFLRNDSLNLSELGQLESRPAKSADDKCRASCVDWYGNARPIFIRGRIFALLGYEIVEGHLTANGIREKHRISFAPVKGTVFRD